MPIRRYVPPSLVTLLEALHCPLPTELSESPDEWEELDLTWEDIGPDTLPPPQVVRLGAKEP